MNARQLPSRDYAALKGAVDALVDKAGGVSAAAGVTRVGGGLISRYTSTSRENETTNAPIDVIADLESEAGEPIVTRVLADLQDCDLVPRHRAKASANYDHHDTDVTKAACALLVAWREGKADGSLDAADLIRLESLATDLQAELAEFRRDARRDIEAADCASGRVTKLRSA